MNIVNLIFNLLHKSDALSKLAPLLGISQGQTDSAINAAVPSLLAGITEKASEPTGAATLAHTLHREEHGFLEDFPGFGTGGTSSRGTDALSSILGENTVKQIGGVLSRFTGINEGIISRLLGMIAPVVLGVIAKNTKGLDPTGISSLLTGQKENIASAMPTGLGSMLASAIPSLGKFFGSSTEQPKETFHTRTTDYEDRTPVGAGHEKSNNAWKWILPLLVAGLVLYFLPRMLMVRNSRDRVPPVGEQRTTELTPTYSTEASKIANEGNTLIKSATDTIGGITDEASAATAAPKLQQISGKLEGLRNVMKQLPEPAQKAVADTLRSPVNRLHSAARPVLSMPTVGPQVKPAIDELFGELNQILGQEEKVISPLP